MAAGLIVIPNFMPALGLNLRPLPGALLYFYLNLTTELTTVYQDAGLSVAHENPVVANALGVFPAIYAPANTYYSVALTTSAGAPKATYDYVAASTGTVGDQIEVAFVAGDAADVIQAALVAAGTYGTVILGKGAWTARPGVISMLEGQHLTANTLGTSIATIGPLTSPSQLIKANFTRNIKISNITLDGVAPTILVVTSVLGGAQTVNVTKGTQYRVAIRADVAATLTISGAVEAGSVMTGTGMTPGSTVVYAFPIASANGTMTLTPSGNVNFLSITQNGGPLSSLLNFYSTDNISIENCHLFNVDTLGIATGNCNNVDIAKTYIQRPVATWDQNVGILCAGGINYTGYRLRGGNQLDNTGTAFVVGDVTIDDGNAFGGTGYGASIAAYIGNGYISVAAGCVFTPNANYPDLDQTVPNIMELQGAGVVMCPKISSNPGGGLYLAGPFRVIAPEIYNTNSYFAALGSYTGAGIVLGYVDSVVNAAGTQIIGGRLGDTRIGNARTQSYGIVDQNSSVSDTSVLDVVTSNNRVGNFNFLGTTKRRFRGARSTFSATFDPPSIAAGLTYTYNITATGALASSRVVSQTLSGASAGLFLLPASPGTDIVSASLVNLTASPIDATTATVTVVVEDSSAGA